MIRALVTITTQIMLNFGDVLASANVKSIKPMTRKTYAKYSRGGYFLLNPGMKAPMIIIVGIELAESAILNSGSI
ncbi:hypothetical protein Tco_1277391, partial [Tanacetum coccineum]